MTTHPVKWLCVAIPCAFISFLIPLQNNEQRIDNEKEDTGISNLRPRHLPVLKIKPETSNLRRKPYDEEKSRIKRGTLNVIDPLSCKINNTFKNNARINKMPTIPSRKCTVLDLLFERQVSHYCRG